MMTFRRAHTLKGILAPSRLKILQEQSNTTGKKRSFKYGTKRCLCCNEIKHRTSCFQSVHTKENFQIKFPSQLSVPIRHISYGMRIWETVCGPDCTKITSKA